jgi:hypothetical protein
MAKNSMQARAQNNPAVARSRMSRRQVLLLAVILPSSNCSPCTVCRNELINGAASSTVDGVLHLITESMLTILSANEDLCFRCTKPLAEKAASEAAEVAWAENTIRATVFSGPMNAVTRCKIIRTCKRDSKRKL